MKKLLLPLLALALSATAAAAQTTPGPADTRPARTPEEMATRQTEALTKQLTLSADQSAKVQQIMLDRDREMLTMRGQAPAGADRSQLREQMQASRAKYDGQLKQVLTPEQFIAYTALQANRRHHGFGGADMQDGKVKAKDGKVKIKTKPTES